VRERGRIAGCGAIKRLDSQHGEIKSMRTAATHRRRGVAALLLTHMEAESVRAGFDRREPFGDYLLDPLSVFMTKRIA
jgi:putative acetyltransferase